MQIFHTMNQRLLPVAIALLIAPAASAAAKLSESEVKLIKSDITHMMELFEKGDAQALLDRTHESIYSLVGGSKETFDKATKDAATQFMQLGVRFLESELGEPTEVYRSGKSEVCFIPRISILEFRGKKVRSEGFMLAARPVGSRAWKYLDGSGLAKNPAMLRQLFPDLDSRAELPPSSVKAL